MENYNPEVTPDPEEWNALGEDERIILVEAYHKQAGIRMPNHLLHATIHTVVENQIAMGDEVPASDTLDRLISEGLDRHEAVHAIGCVLTEHIYDLRQGAKPSDPNEMYFKNLRALTADRWRRMSEQED